MICPIHDYWAGTNEALQLCDKCRDDGFEEAKDTNYLDGGNVIHNVYRDWLKRRITFG
jgi:hypothetical protein